MLNKGGNLIAGKQFTDLAQASALKDSDIIAVHDGNGLKQSNMENVTAYMSNKFSNPNLLINPDFKINQRGKTEYDYQSSGATQYTVDRFRAVYLNVKTASDGLILNANGASAGGGYISQVLEDAVKGDTILSFKVSAVSGTIEFRNLNSADDGDTITISSNGIYTIKGNNTKKVIAHITKGSSCKIEWMKLEQGSIATPFVAPNQAEELLKCLRFTHIISMDNLIGTVNGNKVFVRVSSPLKEGATIKYMKGYMSIAVENEGKDINVGSANIASKGSYVLAFNTKSDTNYVWKACVMSNFTILLDAELY